VTVVIGYIPLGFLFPFHFSFPAYNISRGFYLSAFLRTLVERFLFWLAVVFDVDGLSREKGGYLICTVFFFFMNGLVLREKALLLV